MDKGTFDGIIANIKKKKLTELQMADLVKTAKNNIEDTNADAPEDISLSDTPVEDLAADYSSETEQE